MKFISFITKKNPNNGNEIKSDILPLDIFKSDTTSISNVKKYLNDFQNQNFSVLWQKWTQKMKTEENQTFFHATYSKLTPYLFYQKILKYFNDVQNRNFSFLWLKWSQTMEVKQNQTFFHETYSNLTPYLFLSINVNLNCFQNQNFSVLWLKWTQTMEMKQNQTFFHGTYSNLTPYLSISMTFKIKISQFYD